MLHYQKYSCSMGKEVFKRSAKYPRYLVSNYGTVKNAKTGHIMAHHINSSGYEMVQLTIHQRNHHVLVHRLVAYTFMRNPNPDEMCIVNHIDENPHNNHLDNLEFCDREWNANWGTVKERIQDTQINKRQLVGVFAINKVSKKVFKFDTIKDASVFSGVFPATIRKALKDWRVKIEGDYVFCLPQLYGEKYVEKLINNSLGYHYQKYYNIYATHINTGVQLHFNSLKEAGKFLHIQASKIEELLSNPHASNPTQYVFYTKDYSDDNYVKFLAKCYNPALSQAIPIVGMNINTGEILHFKSIKQAEHQLVNQSVRPYMQGKVKSAKDWVFCKESEYTKKLLQQKAKEAKPHNNFEIVILNCKTGESFKTSSDVKTLAKRYKVSDTTIRNQLNHNALSINGQQFIYADKYNEDLKQVFMESYKKKQRGKAVYAINIDTLEITKYESATDAAEKLGISRDQILSVIRGNSNQTHRYAFSYENYYSKYRMYQLAYFGKYGKAGFPVSSVDSNGKQTFYPAVKEASKQTGVTRNNIFKVLRDEHGSAGGYNWFKEDRDKYIMSLIKH